MTEEFEGTAEAETGEEAPTREAAAAAGSEAQTAAGKTLEETEAIKSDPRDEQDLPLANIIEALLIAAPEPRTAKELAAAAGRKVKPAEVADAIVNLNRHYAETSRAFEIIEVNHAYQIMTLPGYEIYLRPMQKEQGEGRRKLSAAALDTLAIVAYKQPVMRVEIDTIRGVHCGPTLRHLIELGFVRVTGRNREILGYPMLYGTTDYFLETFGLASLDDLPGVEELRQP